MQLTIEQLKNMQIGEMFAHGTFIDSPEGVNVANTGLEVKWLAKRGGIHDWAIYYQNPHYINTDDPIAIEVGYAGVWSLEKITSNGEKLIGEENIKKLVPCDDQAFKMYRY